MHSCLKGLPGQVAPDSLTKGSHQSGTVWLGLLAPHKERVPARLFFAEVALLHGQLSKDSPCRLGIVLGEKDLFYLLRLAAIDRLFLVRVVYRLRAFASAAS